MMLPVVEKMENLVRISLARARKRVLGIVGVGVNRKGERERSTTRRAKGRDFVLWGAVKARGPRRDDLSIKRNGSL